MSETFFLSYSSRDRDFALRLANDLHAAGSHIWVDRIDIRPSDRWDRAVEAALRDCAGILLILSTASAMSENVLDEVTVALDANKPVIPVRIEPCHLPLRLARVQYIDATGDFADTLRRCHAAMVAALKASASVASPTPEVPALSPEITTKVCALLTTFMGPISAHLIREESQGVASLQDLSLRLAAHIPGERDKALFLASMRSI